MNKNPLSSPLRRSKRRSPLKDTGRGRGHALMTKEKHINAHDGDVVAAGYEVDLSEEESKSPWSFTIPKKKVETKQEFEEEEEEEEELKKEDPVTVFAETYGMFGNYYKTSKGWVHEDNQKRVVTNYTQKKHLDSLYDKAS